LYLVHVLKSKYLRSSTFLQANTSNTTFYDLERHP